MRILAAFTAMLMVSAPAVAETNTYYCKFKEYHWKHLNGGPRLLKNDADEEYLFSIEKPSPGERVGSGTFKNLQTGADAFVVTQIGYGRITFIENTFGDNAFVVSIFLSKDFIKPAPAVMSLHSIQYGLQQFEGSCR